MEDIETLRRIMATCPNIAVVGLSANWYRPSFFAAKYLQDHGYNIIPVNPRYETVLGKKCYPDLEAIDEPVDVVDVFQRSEAVMPFAQQAVKINAKVLWLQLGVVNDEAKQLAQSHDMEVVMNRCMKIEHARLFGGLNYCGVDTGIVSAKKPTWLPGQSVVRASTRGSSNG